MFSSSLPALGAQVLHVGMLAHLDRRDRLADVDAVLDHGRAARERPDGQLVADGNVALGLDLEVLVLVHDPAIELLAGLHALDHDDADRVVLVVDHEMDHCRAPVNGIPASARMTRVLDSAKSAPAGQLDDWHVSLRPINPLYLQVRASLIESISSGQWKPGEAIPSEN